MFWCGLHADPKMGRLPQGPHSRSVCGSESSSGRAAAAARGAASRPASARFRGRSAGVTTAPQQQFWWDPTGTSAASGSSCRPNKDADPRSWDEGQLSLWLLERGVSEDIARAFQVHLVNGLLASNLAEGDLVTMGITHPLCQRRVLYEIHQLFGGLPPAPVQSGVAAAAAPATPPTAANPASFVSMNHPASASSVRSLGETSARGTPQGTPSDDEADPRQMRFTAQGSARSSALTARPEPSIAPPVPPRQVGGFQRPLRPGSARGPRQPMPPPVSASRQAADAPMRIAPHLDPPQRARRQRYLELQALSHNLPDWQRDSRLTHRVLQAEVIAHAAAVIQGEQLEVGTEEGMSEKLSMLRWGCEDLLRGEIQYCKSEQANLNQECHRLREELHQTRRERDECEIASQARAELASHENAELRKQAKAKAAECDALRFELGGLKLRVQCQKEELSSARGTPTSRQDEAQLEAESAVPAKAQPDMDENSELRWTSFDAETEKLKCDASKDPDVIIASKPSEVKKTRPSSARRAQCAVLNARTAKPYACGAQVYGANAVVCGNE